MTTIEINPTSNYFTSTFGLEDEIIVRKNRLVYGIVVITMTFAVYGVNAEESENPWIPLIFSIIFAIAGLGGIYNFFDRSIQLKLNKIGIYTPEVGLIKWGNISQTMIEIQIHSSGDNHETDYFLIIELISKKTKRTDITHLSKDAEWIANKIECFRIKYSDSGLNYKLSC